MQKSLMRMLAALVLMAAAMAYHGRVQAANAAAATAEETDCWTAALGCMATAGYPEEMYDTCYEGNLWTAAWCHRLWGGGYGYYCGPIGTCGDEPPSCTPTEEEPNCPV